MSDADAQNTATLTEGTMILPVCSIFRRYLKRQGLKFTTERAMILNAVLARQSVFEAEDLLDELKSGSNRVSKATVYRTLKHLLEANIITEVLIDSRQAHYQLSIGHAPTGHLVCPETGKIIEFPIDELEALAKRVCADHGFEHVSHRFVIYGVSPEARRDAEAEAESAPDA